MQTATRKTANLGHAKFGMGASIGNLSQEIAIFSSRFSRATPVINSSGFWTFGGLGQPRDSLSGSTGTYTSQFLSPQPQLITHAEPPSLRPRPRFGIAFQHLVACTTK
jgi:hypothetical protein